MPLPAGARLGPYEIVSPLGAGGMGEVYRARDTRLDREVAVKVLPESPGSGQAWERFEREARAASALNHQNICAVYDVGEANGLPYLVMELLEGQTLHDYLGRQPAKPAIALVLAVQIADALEAAHGRRIIHRDIKASNIMVTGRRHVKVLDFGLAKHTPATESTLTMQQLTASGMLVGTPHYMPPETLQGLPADARSDLWALGIVLHEMLTGQLPFRGSTVFEISSAILHKDPPPLPPEIPSGLRAIVGRCLEKRPDERYQTASEVRIALESLQSLPLPAGTSGMRRWLIAVPALALAAAGLYVWQRQPTQQARPKPGPTLSTGAKQSTVREANEAYELTQVELREGNIPRAQELIRRALTLDPHFAAGHHFLATTYNVQIIEGNSNDASLLYKSDEELRLAVQEDPSLPGIQGELAGLALLQGDKQRAAVALERILARDPLSPTARLFRAGLLVTGEENAEAKENVPELLALNPLLPPPRLILINVLLTEGDVTGALREALTLAELAPNAASAVGSLSNVYMALGELDKARKLLEEKRVLLGKNYTWRVAWALLLALEKNEEASRAMDTETLKWLGNAPFTDTLHAAEFFALIGDTPNAIDWFDRAVRRGDERVGWFQRNPRLASIRQDPNFQRIINSIQARRNQISGK